MRAQFQVAVGGGRAGASLSFERRQAEQTFAHRWVLLLAAVLTLPFAVALTTSAIADATHSAAAAAVPHWLTASGTPGFGRLLAFGPVLAVLVLAASRLRLAGGREDGRWVGTVHADLGRLEIAVGLLALAVAAVFFGHLVADSLACAYGKRSAC